MSLSEDTLTWAWLLAAALLATLVLLSMVQPFLMALLLAALVVSLWDTLNRAGETPIQTSDAVEGNAGEGRTAGV